MNKDNGGWYPCKLPNNGNTVKVQFVFGFPEVAVNQVKKEEPVVVPPKKL